MSSVSDVVEGQSGWPPEDVFLEEARSSRVDLADVVEEFRVESMFTGKTSWDQYRQVFEAIVSSNGWDSVTAALQLVSHLGGDALNVALLVPASWWVMPGVLLDTLTEHYSSPGRLADNRRRFERVSRKPGEDTSLFAVELETLALKAFGDLSSSARLQLVRDRFIVGQVGCSLRRHLDGVEPGTPIRDIVDRCRVWESHAEDTDCRGTAPIRIGLFRYIRLMR